jgi:starch phosphorylase
VRDPDQETADAILPHTEQVEGRSEAVHIVQEPGSWRASRLREAILGKLAYSIGKRPSDASEQDWFRATALAVRDLIVDSGLNSGQLRNNVHRKHIYYLSLEFLIGRLLSDTLCNLDLTEAAREALARLGVDLERIRTAEPDAALGNGGLGRLAACFMESMATVGLPAVGYGIRYDYGLFRQSIVEGWQKEAPDNWMARGNPWEIERPEIVYAIQFGGLVEPTESANGLVRYVWHPAETVHAAAFDTLIPGWGGDRVNTLRLWAARAVEPLNLDLFNAGDHVGAQSGRARAEAISRVLYPSDATAAGRELRLKQEYFFTSASLQDLLWRHLESHGSLTTLPHYAAIQLNDTHPAIAVAELMRLLVDEHGMAWEEAWRITTETLNYTNHTLMPEALESWPVSLMERLLPRHMQIIHHINWLHLESLKGRELTAGALEDVSIIDEADGKRVRMGHLAFLGSHKVNGVSALHTELMRETVFAPLHALYPDRITNKTNGITFRRWLHQANPGLTHLLVESLGDGVLEDAGALTGLEGLAEQASFQDLFKAQRAVNKNRLSKLIAERTGVRINPDALFDVQIKRIHEYKRQLLNILETVALYHAMRSEPHLNWVPRVKIFAGKAAPSYTQAKLIIKLANDVAHVVNTDPLVAGRLNVVFIPNYNVSLAEEIIPAADLSEQISTAGLEASGTGNMKLALNGALTIGTLDGANIEISERVGSDNIVIFGLTADEVKARKSTGLAGMEAISPRLRSALDDIQGGRFSPDDPGRFSNFIEALKADDRYMIAADFEAYWSAQRYVDELWRDQARWWRAAVLNTARIAWFSSDRTIREYAGEIWKVS